VTARTNIGRRMEILSVLLEHEARTGRGLGVVGVAEAVSREKSLVSRALAALHRDGMVERDPDTMEFTVGDRLLAIAAGAGDPVLVEVATPFVRQLAERVGERASLLIEREGQGINLQTSVADVSVQAVAWRGRSTPLHCTASGRVLLMERNREEIRAAIGDDPLPLAGPRAPRTFADYWTKIEQARTDGYSISDAELDPDIIGIAAPVRRGSSGPVIAALAITAPGFRLRPCIPTAIELVVSTASACSEALTP